jgi:hypothetical protein
MCRVIARTGVAASHPVDPAPDSACAVPASRRAQQRRVAAAREEERSLEEAATREVEGSEQRLQHIRHHVFGDEDAEEEEDIDVQRSGPRLFWGELSARRRVAAMLLTNGLATSAAG